MRFRHLFEMRPRILPNLAVGFLNPVTEVNEKSDEVCFVRRTLLTGALFIGNADCIHQFEELLAACVE